MCLITSVLGVGRVGYGIARDDGAIAGVGAVVAILYFCAGVGSL
jgi:hypothetical protein